MSQERGGSHGTGEVTEERPEGGREHLKMSAGWAVLESGGWGGVGAWGGARPGRRIFALLPKCHL